MAKRSYFHDIASVFSSNIFTLITNLLLVVLLTRILGPEHYGLYTAILVVPMLVVSFFQMGIRATTVYMIGSGKEDDNRIVSAVLTILLFTSILGMIFSGVAYFFVSTEGYTYMLIGMALLIIPMRLTTIYTGGVFLGKEEIPQANLMNWLTGSLVLIFATLFVLILKWELNGALLSLLLANFIVAVVAVVMLLRRFKVSISVKNPLLKGLIGMGVVYALSFLVIQLNYRLDVLLLKALSTPAEVGIYSLGVSVAELLWQIPLAISVVVMSRSANATDSKAMNSSTARLLRISLVFGLVISLFIVFLSPWVVPLVFGEKFRSSVLIMQTILPGILMVIVFRILSGQLSGMGRPEVALKAFLPALVLNVVLNYLLIPGYGAIGSVMATNISYTIGSVSYLIAYSRISGMRVRAILRFSREDWVFLKRIRNKFSGVENNADPKSKSN